MGALLMESPTLECVNEDDVGLNMEGWELEPESEDGEKMVLILS